MEDREGNEPQKYPLNAEQVRKNRIRRNKASIESELRSLDYDRRELLKALQQAQQVYINKLQRISKKMDGIVSRQRDLLKQTGELMKLVGSCSAWADAVLPIDGHLLHVCAEEPGHQGIIHKCSCRVSFTASDE